MSLSTDVRTNQQVLFPVAHLFMQEAIWLANVGSHPLDWAWHYTFTPSEFYRDESFLKYLEKLNQQQLPERAQSLVEQRWYEAGRAQVDEALYHLEEWPQHQNSTLEWIEIYCAEWYDANALILHERCSATATAFFNGMTDAMLELL